MSNIGITRMISDLFFGSSRERVKNKDRKMMSKKLTVLAIVALIGLTMCSIALAKKPPKPPPPPPPDADPAIAYVLDGDIWVMDADGSNNTLVTENGARPCWSPNGLKLAFNSYSYLDRDWGMYTINLDGTGEFLVTMTQSLKEWSPGDVLGKGEKILCVAPDESDPYGPCDLFLISPDGTGLVRLTNTPDIHEGNVACWSPDAKSIAAACFDEGSYVPQWLSVYELGLDADGEIYVENTININEMAADAGVTYPTNFGTIEWANTQDKIVTGLRRTDVYAFDTWTLDLGPPYHMQQITGEGYEADFPVGGAGVMASTWSPDDTSIAFAVSASPKYKKLAGIYAVDAEDGANMEKLEDGACREPDWYRYAE